MRNIFYPQRKAAYLSKEQLRNLREREVPIERDSAFRIEKPKVALIMDEPSPQPHAEPNAEPSTPQRVVNVEMDFLPVFGSYESDLKTQC